MENEDETITRLEERLSDTESVLKEIINFLNRRVTFYVTKSNVYEALEQFEADKQEEIDNLDEDVEDLREDNERLNGIIISLEEKILILTDDRE
jgi:DNA repair exonuclease SbcCD ATPase subunit